MLQEFIMKQMMLSQLKKMGLPKDKQDKILNVIMKNPEFFKQMGEEMQKEIKNGGNQMVVAQKVASKYQEQLKNILSGEGLN